VRRKSMRQNKIGKITASVILEINQLERLNEIAHDSRVSRSTIVRDAIEHELERYDNALPPRKVERSPREEGSGAAPKTVAPRP
jgi:hypothetical protein